MRLIRPIAAAALLLVVSAVPVMAQEWIADIKAAPNRFVNREVTVVGQVMSTASNPVGTTRGIYILVDDSDPAGIGVRTRELPAPGLEFSVTGIVTQDPQSGAYLITESSRTAASRPAWLFPVLISLSVIVLVLIVMLVRSLSGSGRAKPAAATAEAAQTVRPSAPPAAPTVRPAPAPPASVSGPVSASSPGAGDPGAGEQTEVIDSSEATEVFRSLGASLVVTAGPDSGKEYPIGKDTTLIGRSGRRANDVELTDSAVSREQAKVMHNAETGTFTLVNESKTNPSHVDGVSVDAKQLEDGAVIEIGKTTMTFTKS